MDTAEDRISRQLLARVEALEAELAAHEARAAALRQPPEPLCRVDREGGWVAPGPGPVETRAIRADGPHGKPRQVKPPLLSVVIPLFNEESNVGPLYLRLVDALDTLEEPYEILFVNDGSRDETPGRLERLQDEDPHISVLHLSRNFGHQAAVSAGLEYSRGRAVVVMDGDLQDPPRSCLN